MDIGQWIENTGYGIEDTCDYGLNFVISSMKAAGRQSIASRRLSGLFCYVGAQLT